MQRKKPFFHWLTGWLLLSLLGVGILGGASLTVRAAPRQQTVGSIVISEFRTNGPNGGTDEFIDLYNQTNTNICVENWELRVLTGSGNEVRATIPSGVAIGAGSHYLIANNDYGGASDLSYGTGIVDSGGIAIFNENGVKIDSVGTSSTSDYSEGTYLNPLTGNQNRSYERVFDSGSGTYIDTDDNINDFQEISPSTPENSVAAPVTCKFTSLSVVISEVAWMGTLASPDDEWIELYNPGSSPIDLENWRLVADDGSPDIVISKLSPNTNTIIPPSGFLVLERAYDNVVIDVTADQIYVGELEDAGETLRLRAPDGSIVDTANSDGGAWPAGTISPNGSMERMGVIKDEPLAWVTNVNTSSWTHMDASGQLVHGTPKGANWGFGVTHTPIPPPTSTPAPTDPLTIVISEVAWAGTQSSTNDEWIELYNPGTKSVDLTGWNLRSSDGSPNIDNEFDGITLGAGKYLLLERTDDDTTDVAANVIYTGSLSNSGEILRLYDPNGYIVDTANSNGGAWPAGISSTYSSMERSLIATDSNFVWVTYDASKDNPDDFAHDASGNDIKGTPGRGNKPFNVTPTPTPRSNTGSSGGNNSGGSGTVTLPPILGISEFLPRPGYDWNNDGVVDVFDEFIEIINAGQIDVNLSSYRLDDEENLGSVPYTLPAITLKPGERAVFYAAETGIMLSDAGDTVRLLRGSSTVVDAYTYSVVRYPDQSWCRIPDRLGYWNEPCFPTPGNPNALTGTNPLPPGGSTGYLPSVCLLPDTTPNVFVYAECEVGGDKIWNRRYWDKEDDAEQVKLEEPQKWETLFE